MPRQGRLVAWLVSLHMLGAMVAHAMAEAPSPQSSGPGLPFAPTPLPIPPGLPVYELDVRVNPSSRLVVASQRVTFTNRATAPVPDLVFHVYPRYKVPEGDRALLAKTLEALRLSPEEAMDLTGRRLSITSASVGDTRVPIQFDPSVDTILILPLPEPLSPGHSVTATLTYRLELPEKWGRWGLYDGVTYLANWYPVLAFHDEQGWDRAPFVPWHQPWHQEAGHYRVRLELPEDHQVASTGRIVSTEKIAPGFKRLTIVAPPSRDFALVASARYRVVERVAGATRIRVLAFPEDGENASRILDYACEVVPLYERWFGPYYDSEFEIAASFFGWNGNECSGLVLLDRRIMRLPSVGERYLDHLVTHETCHQWWWNVIGTDGFAEPFMDEGLVNCFSAIHLDRKYGRNAPLIVWPRGVRWLPTIGREDLRLSSYYGWRARGGGGPVIQDLGSMGDLESLFSLAYDRGGKVVQMLDHRMGDERFFAFFQTLYRKYPFQTLSYSQFRSELEAFDPGKGWPQTLDSWLLAHNECDWAIDGVEVQRDPADPALERISVRLEQRGQLEEPTILLVRCPDREIRVPIWPDAGTYEIPGAHVARLTIDRPASPTPRRPAGLAADSLPGPLDLEAAQASSSITEPPARPEPVKYLVTLYARSRPSQVEVDPDHALLDAQPDNNRWRPAPAFRLTPMMTPLDGSPWFQPFDRPGIVAGPFVDQYARAGLRAAAERINRWQISGWMGVEPALEEAIFGGQAVLLNAPGPRWNTGIYFEEGLYNFHNDQRHSGGRAFLRKRLYTSSSFLVDDPAFFELYYGFGNEFWPGDDGRPTADWLAALGGRFWRNTLFPYWDPVQGTLVEFAAERGDRAYGSPFDYTRIMGQYGLVTTLPESWGSVSRVRLALRGYGGYGWGDDHYLFRLGGGRRLRALNLQQEWGSSVWLLTSELRFPLWRRIDRDAVDHILHFKNLYGVAFVDAGQSYFNGAWNPVVIGPGIGVRLDLALFSFLERATVRLDLAQPIYGEGSRPPSDPGAGGPVLWFGLNQVF